MNKRNILIVLLIMFVLGIAWGNLKSKSVSENTKPTVKIGISLPLTGVGSNDGQSAKLAAEMSVKKSNNNENKYNYELIFEDTKIDLKLSSMAMNKFVNMDKVNATISIWGYSGQTFSEYNNISKKPLPNIACAWGTSSVRGEYNFNNVTSIENYSDLLISKLKEEKMQNIGFVFQNASYSVEMREILMKKVRDAGFKVVFDEFFNYGEKDFKTFLSKQKGKDIDIVFSLLLAGNFQLFYQQMKEMNISVPVTTIDNLWEIDNIESFNGTWFVSSNFGQEDFIKEWNEITDVALGTCASNVYDNVNILIEAFENSPAEDGKVPTSEAVKDYIRGLKEWNGASGELTFREDGHIDSKPKLAIVKNGKIEILEE